MEENSEEQVPVQVMVDAAASMVRALIEFVNAQGALVETFRYARKQGKPKPRGPRAKKLSKALWVGYLAALREEKKNRGQRLQRVMLAPPLPADLVSKGDEE